MPRVPTILADEKLNAPGFSSNADPSSFGSNEGLANLPRGMNQAAVGLSRLGREVEVAHKRRADEIDERWVGDSVYQERNHLNEWQSDPQNNSSEDFSKNFKNYAESRVKAYEKAAPSKRALQSFTSHMQSFVESRYASALVTSERTRVENTKDSIINQTSQALGMFRGQGGSPNVDATVELLDAHDDIRARVTKLYGEVDPILRRKLGAYVDSEFALGVAPQDPEQARAIIKGSRDLEESAKVVLINKVDSMERDVMSAGRDDFNRFRADYMVLGRDGKRKDTIPLEQYKSYYDNDTAVKLKKDDDQKLRIFEKVNTTFDTLSATNPEYQNRNLSEIRSKVTGAEDDMAYDLLREKVAQVQKLQEKDPVSWLQGYNQEVIEANKKAQVATGAGVEDALKNRSMTILKYQGPPQDAVDPEKYLGRPILDRRLMTESEVEKNRGHINQGTPPEVIKRLGQVLATYPGQENQDIAFNDMARDPQGLRQDYRLIWQNKDQWWVQTFVSALGDAKGFSGLTDERKGALSKEVEESEKWLAFKQAMVGPDPSKGDQIEGFKQGIMTYANYFAASQGMKMSAAVDQSIKHLLDSTTGITSMNGRPMVIMRERGHDKPYRTDEEVKDVGRRLNIALKDLDPRQIEQSKFFLSAISKDEKNIDRLQALRDQITRTGHFVPNMDGQSMILYAVGDAGIPFEVRDKDKRAFTIQLDDLPTFIFPATQYDDYSESGLSGKEFEMRPVKDYPLQEFSKSAGILDKTLWHWTGVYYKQTHWPTNSGYWKRTDRKGLQTVPGKVLDAGPIPKGTKKP